MNAIILTGGRSSRFGSNKSEALLGENSLLQFLTDQLSDCSLIIVGPTSPITAQYVLENPPGGGPVAGIAAGMELVESERVAIYAVDTPFLPQFRTLLENSFDHDGVVALDGEGFHQYLGGIYRTTALREVIKSQGDASGLSVRKLFSTLNLITVELEQSELLMDIDNQTDLARAQAIYERIVK